MDYGVLSSLSLICLAAGLTLYVTSRSLARRARSYQAAMQSLLQLGAKGLDPLDIPPAAWPLLAAGGWQHLQLSGDWFGYLVESDWGKKPEPLLKQGQKTSTPLAFRLSSGDDVLLVLTLSHSAVRGEGRMFADQLAKVFVLLLESALRVRTEAISVAMAERARLTLYLQHDMRNLAQWVGWVCTDFNDCDQPESLLIAARRLQQNAPLARERADRLVAMLGNNPANQQAARLDLRRAVENAAHLAGVQVTVSGQANAWIAQALLARALDNLFSNLAPNWRNPGADKPVLHLRTSTESAFKPAMAELRFFSPWPDAQVRISPMRLFEPFASGRPRGLGLGLYQARKSLQEANGDLSAEVDSLGITFVLTIPDSTMPVAVTAL
jgi:hypothetical protein